MTFFVPKTHRGTVAALVAGCFLIGALATAPQAAEMRSGPTRPPRRAIVHHADGARMGQTRVNLSTAYIDHGAGEPTIGTDQNGVAFVAAAETISFDATIPQIDVMRSTDEGYDWEVVSPNLGGANVHASTGDPYVYVDTFEGGSRVFTVDLQGYVCSLLSFSDDAGTSWQTNPLGCGRPVNDHQTLFAAPPVTSPTIGYPHVVYYCFQDVASSSCTKSLDGGITFVPTGNNSFSGLDEDGTFCGGLHGHGFGASDGSIYIPKVQCGKPLLAISRDEGASWKRHRVSTMPGAGHDGSVAVDGAGNIYFAFIAKNLHPYLVTSRDEGQTWSKPMMIGSPGVIESSLATLDASDDGEVVVAYMGSENPDKNHSPNQTWNGYLTRISDPLTRTPTLTSVQMNRDDDPLVRGDCPQTKCGPEYDFIDVVFDRSGDVWAAVVDGCMGICVTTVGPNDANVGLVAHWRD